jgi:hypothetical protein
MGENMPNYSEIKSYWTKFATDATADVKSFWKTTLRQLKLFIKNSC